MEPGYSVFSTAPVVPSNNSGSGGSAAGGGLGGGPGIYHSLHYDAGSSLGAGGAGMMNGAAGGMGAGGAPYSHTATPPMAFSTAANPLTMGSGFGGYGTYHLSSAVDLGSGGVDSRSFESFNHTLSVLQGICEGRPVVQWARLIDPEQPAASAQLVAAALGKENPSSRGHLCREIAACLTTPAHVAILSQLEEPYRNDVRNVLLQELLNQLTVAGDQPMPLCAAMLAEMASHNLVRLSGVAATVEQFLCEPDKRRAGIAVLGRVAEQLRGNESFSRSVRNAKNLEPMLCSLYKDPAYEYDVIAITRLLGGVEAERNVASLLPAYEGQQPAPITCMDYIHQRDELVSCHADGTVVLWGGPNAAGKLQNRIILDLSADCIPLGVSAPAKESYLVVAAMPSAAAAGGDSTRGPRGISAGSMSGGVLRILSSGEHSGAWPQGEVIARPAENIISAVVGLPNAVVCAAERVPTNGGGVRHDLQFFSAATGQAIRSLPSAHADYTTVLSTWDDAEPLLLSGSRDATVKLWDMRSGSSNPTAFLGGLAVAGTNSGCSFYQMDAKHTDTITSVYAFGNYFFTGSLDGSTFMWDARRMTTPFKSHQFSSPVLGITALEGYRTAVATARGLSLLAVETMGVLDVVPNVCFSSILSNDDGSAVFAASATGLNVYALHK